MKIGIIDYQLNNINSIQGALKRLNYSPQIVREPNDLFDLDRIILPGVGSFTMGMQSLASNNWIPQIKEAAINLNIPLLGICLGMQLLADSGFEGAEKNAASTPGLGIIPGSVEILPVDIYDLKLPHVGWDEISLTANNSEIFSGIDSNTDFYFVHSYYFKPLHNDVTLSTCNYGINFPSVIKFKNTYGMQFHPEKSSRAGLQILKNFIEKP